MTPTALTALRSFVSVTPETQFPIQNLPYGVFTPHAGGPPRVGVAIGDAVLDLAVLEERGFFSGPELRGRVVFRRPALNAFLACGPAAWREARAQITHLLRADVPTLRDDVSLRDRALVPIETVTLCLPCEIGDYSDFYASRTHAANVGQIFRGPDAALPPNYLQMPIGYHGRASSVVVSGTDLHRPRGQFKVPGRDAPVFAPSRELDFELEIGLIVGRGNELGHPVPMRRALDGIFGLVLLNDWSARDIQRWEYAPLGPFLGKSFGTSISPWVVPLEALEPFRCGGPLQDPEPLPHLRSQAPQTFDVHLEVALQTQRSPTPHRISRTNLRELYWSLAQMVAHHTSNGCNLRPGDLLGTGTISGRTPDSFGSLLELAWHGARPLKLPGGEERSFLEDGDTVILSGWCAGDGYRVGWGECAGTVQPALEA